MPDTARDVVADSARAIAEADELRREVARLRAALEALEAHKREPLTDEQINTLTAEQLAKADQTLPVYLHHREFARAVERAHGITKEPQ